MTYRDFTLKSITHLVEHFARTDREPGYWEHLAGLAYRAEAAATRELTALNYLPSPMQLKDRDLAQWLNDLETVNSRECAGRHERAAVLNNVIEILRRVRDICMETVE